jgi:hypothetical protein
MPAPYTRRESVPWLVEQATPSTSEVSPVLTFEQPDAPFRTVRRRGWLWDIAKFAWDNDGPRSEPHQWRPAGRFENDHKAVFAHVPIGQEGMWAAAWGFVSKDLAKMTAGTSRLDDKDRASLARAMPRILAADTADIAALLSQSKKARVVILMHPQDSEFVFVTRPHKRAIRGAQYPLPRQDASAETPVEPPRELRMAAYPGYASLDVAFGVEIGDQIYPVPTVDRGTADFRSPEHSQIPVL